MVECRAWLLAMHSVDHPLIVSTILLQCSRHLSNCVSVFVSALVPRFEAAAFGRLVETSVVFLSSRKPLHTLIIYAIHGTSSVFGALSCFEFIPVFVIFTGSGGRCPRPRGGEGGAGHPGGADIGPRAPVGRRRTANTGNPWLAGKAVIGSS